MRILHLTDRWTLGGLPRVVHDLATWQQAGGHDTVVAVGSLEPLAPSRDVVLDPGLAESDTGRRLLRAARAIHHLDVRLRPRVIHVHQRGLALAALLATGRSRRVVEHVHVPFTDRRLSSFRSPTLLAVGAGVRRMIVEDYGRAPDRVLRVINGVRDLGAAPLSDGPPFVVAGLGRLSREKGPDRFMLAAEELARRRAPVTACWMGNGDMAADLVGSHAVSLVAADLDVRDHLRRAHLLLSPSRKDSMTLAIIEAMSVGRPVVATDVGSVAELVEDGRSGRLVPPDASPAEMADAVESLLDMDLLHRMSAHARRAYEQSFTLEHMCRSVDAAYRTAGLL